MTESKPSSATLSTTLSSLRPRTKSVKQINILICCGDWESADRLNRAFSRLRYKVMQAASLYEVLPLMKFADILVLRMDLPNGHSHDVLDQWVREKGGMPALCLEDEEAEREAINDLLTCAWNVLAQPFDEIHVITVVERLAMVVRGVSWGKQVESLKRRVWVMWIVIAILVAKDIGWPLIQSVLAWLG